MFTAMSEHDARNWGSQVWDTINGPNLRQNIAPTSDRATAILVKGARTTPSSGSGRCSR